MHTAKQLGAKLSLGDPSKMTVTKVYSTLQNVPSVILTEIFTFVTNLQRINNDLVNCVKTVLTQAEKCQAAYC